MKFAIKSLIAFYCLVFISTAWAALPTGTPEDVGLSSQRLGRIDAVLTADVENGKIPGAVLLVVRKGKIAYYKSFGTRDGKKSLSMEKDSVFRVFSMTKSVVGAAAMILLEEGKLVLADPVAKYIPSFKDIQVFGGIKKDEAGAEVVAGTSAPKNVMTIQDLLKHTSGLSYWFYPPKAIQAMYLKADLKNNNHTLAEMCDKLAKIPLVEDPGTRCIRHVLRCPWSRDRGRLRHAPEQVFRRTHL